MMRRISQTVIPSVARDLGGGAARFRRPDSSPSARLGMTVLFMVLVAACNAPEQRTTGTPAAPATVAPPSSQEAKQVITSSQDWSEYQFTNAAVTIPMNRSAMNGVTAQMASELVQAGWIDMPGDTVVLTAKSASDKRFIARPNGFLDMVPVAKKEFGDVFAMRPNADGSYSADFNWRWIPNEVGQSFKEVPIRKQFDAVQTATAVLKHSSDGWSVSRIDPFKPNG